LILQQNAINEVNTVAKLVFSNSKKFPPGPTPKKHNRKNWDILKVTAPVKVHKQVKSKNHNK
jgi:hypothetical protein